MNADIRLNNKTKLNTFAAVRMYILLIFGKYNFLVRSWFVNNYRLFIHIYFVSHRR